MVEDSRGHIVDIGDKLADHVHGGLNADLLDVRIYLAFGVLILTEIATDPLAHQLVDRTDRLTWMQWQPAAHRGLGFPVQRQIDDVPIVIGQEFHQPDQKLTKLAVEHRLGKDEEGSDRVVAMRLLELGFDFRPASILLGKRLFYPSVEFSVIGDDIGFMIGAEPQETQHVAVFSFKNGFAEYAAFTIPVDGRLRD